MLLKFVATTLYDTAALCNIVECPVNTIGTFPKKMIRQVDFSANLESQITAILSGWHYIDRGIASNLLKADKGAWSLSEVQRQTRVGCPAKLPEAGDKYVFRLYRNTIKITY